jgi:anti-anti-sigma regulatory factor
MNKLQLAAKEVDGKTVLFLEGYLNESGGKLLQRTVEDLLACSPPALALDFAGTSLVNSIGISSLLEVIETARRKNTVLELVRVPEEIASLFRLLGIAVRVEKAAVATAAPATASQT